eukprot:CAMPEP_0172396172 /NCGR_PEP_ID=MMETSP1061-20121228/24136_1 /TAXON_ID=37318 /ORGANISM="Pseudo-nitzschia pungens, Strain cf. pungens" /LENGTH=450 /DNA_ID=CAMNT_0013127969 /DNA_START=118 /DNA_END=1470 /DNA_ORIENTATION=+
MPPQLDHLDRGVEIHGTSGVDDCDDCDDNEDGDHFKDSFSVHPEEEEEDGDEPPRQRLAPAEDARSSTEENSSLVASVFPSFFHSGFEGKASLKELKYWIALSLTLDGRDKMTKVLQYVSRLLGWWYLSRAGSHGTCTSRAHWKRFSSLSKSLGKSRKAFRLGRSINEIHKISSMGLLGLLYWHLKQQYLEDSRKASEKSDRTNGGLDGNNSKESCELSSSTSWIGGSQTLLSKLHPKLFGLSDRICSLLSSSLGAVFPTNEDTRVVWWKVIASAFKTSCMLGYWLGDNANFLTSSGALDDYTLPDKDRMTRRKRWLKITGEKANQFYFFATLMGLATNSYSYHRFQLKNGAGEGQEGEDGNENSGPEIDKDQTTTESRLTKKKQEEKKQFALFLAVLKSWMDVIVFSNNPGLDLHQKWRGRKNHEVIHCLCGLISAGTGLYNNFPDANR